MNRPQNRVGFLGISVIGIMRPGRSHMLQLVACYGHLQEQVMKFLSVSDPNGLALHAFGPLEVRRNEYAL